jgi:hypothetical protein
MKGYRMPEIGLSIRGSKGTLTVDDDEVNLKIGGRKTFTWYKHDLKDNVSFWLGDSAYFREDEYFIKRISEGLSAEPDFCAASKVDNTIF